MQKPRADMGSLSISKDRAVAAVPFKPAAPEPASASPSGDKSLTVKLTALDYQALREHCIQQERATGQRVTHQAIMVAALRAWLAAAKG